MEIILVLIVAVTVWIAVKRKRRRAMALQQLHASIAEQHRQKNRVVDQVETGSVVKEREALQTGGLTISINLTDLVVGNTTRNSDEVESESESCWVPPGKPVAVAGCVISDGMVYVGERLYANSGWGMDAALISPSLPVDQENVDRLGQSMSYWPSYSKIGPGNRAAYLEWLAEGRCNPDIYIGYVFLFFYGIERRLLYDAENDPMAKGEIPVLLKEVGRLIDIYGAKSASFENYARGFIDAMNLSVDRNEYVPTASHLDHEGLDYPLHFKLAVGKIVNSGVPLPAALALDWVRFNPERQFRTSALRCADEFGRLFEHQYLKTFPGGLTVKTTPTRLSGRYKPASPTLSAVPLALPDLPDVTRLKTPIKQLVQLVDPVQDALVQYSRIIGQGIDRNSIPAIATLPLEIQESELTGDAKVVVDLVEASLATSQIAVIKAQNLVARYPSKTLGKLTKTEATLLVEFLAKRGIGVEPDIRFGGTNLSTTEYCAVYRLTGDNHEPGDGYRTATVLLHLAVAVAQSDGDVVPEEQKQLEQHLENALNLPERDRKRLAAHLCWLCADPPKLTVAKSRVEELDERQRRSVAQFLISIAAADGRISPSEVKVLSKIYALLGLDPSSVYGDVHSLSIGDGGPVTVMRSEKVAKTYSIPQQQNQESSKAEESISLDIDRINRIRENSKEAAELLSGVFATNETETAAETTDDLAEASDDVTSEIKSGLDSRHAAFLKVLCERSHWSRSDFELLAQRYDLLPIGAIEVLNEISFETCGEPLLEGDDPIEINQFAVSECL